MRSVGRPQTADSPAPSVPAIKKTLVISRAHIRFSNSSTNAFLFLISQNSRGGEVAQETYFIPLVLNFT